MKVIPMFALVVCLLLVAPAFAQESNLTGCAAKRQELNQQIQQAHAAGNSKQEAGLKKALKENQSHCTDASLAKERQDKVAKAEREVTEREADLKKAEAKGDEKKINQRKAKLADAQRELSDAQAELNR